MKPSNQTKITNHQVINDEMVYADGSLVGTGGWIQFQKVIWAFKDTIIFLWMFARRVFVAWSLDINHYLNPKESERHLSPRAVASSKNEGKA